MDFGAAIKKGVEKYKGGYDKTVSITLLSLSRSIAIKTPVDLGRAAGNWSASLTVPVQGVSDEIKPQFSLMDAVTKQAAGEVYYFVNNLPYIRTLEYGGYPNPPKGGKGKTINGYSRKAAEGMVRVTLENVQSHIDNAIGQLK